MKNEILMDFYKTLRRKRKIKKIINDILLLLWFVFWFVLWVGTIYVGISRFFLGGIN